MLRVFYNLKQNFSQTPAHATITVSSVRACQSHQKQMPAPRQHCWCKIGGFKPNDESIKIPSNPMPWVYIRSFSNDNLCAETCPIYCNTYWNDHPGYRRAITGQD